MSTHSLGNQTNKALHDLDVVRSHHASAVTVPKKSHARFAFTENNFPRDRSRTVHVTAHFGNCRTC